MITFDEVGIMLDDIAEEIPKDFYRELNGGVFLMPDVKMHPQSRGDGSQIRLDNLYIMGEYHNERTGYGGLGRYIVIYYGSFMRLHAHSRPEKLKEELRRVLLHEFTHHLESLAGERGLEIKDAEQIQKYKDRFMK